MERKTKISVEDLNLYYGENHALKNVNMDICENAITAFIGPSGCGKSTFLKTLNRMNDLVENVRLMERFAWMEKTFMAIMLIQPCSASV